MKGEYFILNADIYDERFCGIWERKEEFEKFHFPAQGIEMGDLYPEDVRFQMSDDKPGLMVPDYIDNALSYTMVSERLKNILQEEVPDGIEYLPFTLLNHRGRVAASPCYIVNILGTVDCVDTGKTEGDKNRLQPGRLRHIDILYLDEPKVPKDLKIFRIETQPKTILVRKDLKERFESENITGVEYLNLEEELDW